MTGGGRFRQKPIEIDAIAVADALYYAAHDWSSLPVWLKDAYERGYVLFGNKSVMIRTLERRIHEATFDSWIIRGVAGELYSCKHDIFLKTYEDVTTLGYRGDAPVLQEGAK